MKPIQIKKVSWDYPFNPGEKYYFWEVRGYGAVGFGVVLRDACYDWERKMPRWELLWLKLKAMYDAKVK